MCNVLNLFFVLGWICGMLMEVVIWDVRNLWESSGVIGCLGLN